MPALHGKRACRNTGPCLDGHLGWEQRATRDEDKIRRAWRSRCWNVGIATGPSALVVVDLDYPKDRQRPPPQWAGCRSGEDVLRRLAEEADQEDPFDTYTVRTASGGQHLYFTAIDGPPIGNSVGRRGKGIGWLVDVRAHGGCVLAAGSRVHGRRYDVIDHRAPQPLPGWLAARIRQSTAGRAAIATGLPSHLASGPIAKPGSYGEAAVLGELERVLAAPVGERNDQLNASAFALGQLVANGLVSPTIASEALLRAGLRVGLSHQECLRTIRSGMDSGVRKPRRGRQ